MGMPKNFGWQAQLIHRLKAEEKLDWFWARHSVPNGMTNENLNAPHEVDTSFSEALEPTLQLLEKKFGGIDSRRIGNTVIPRDAEVTTSVSFDDVIGLCVALQRQTNVLLQHIKQSKS
jgi:hypothetical protein